MALNGSFGTSITTANGQLDERYPRNLVVIWSATQNISNNTSTINWTLKTGNSTNSERYTSVNKIKLIINGTVVFNDQSTGVFYTANQVLGSGKITVAHNADGTKNVSIYAEAGFYEWTPNSTGSGTLYLDAIPRTSTINFPEFIMGSASTITINQAASAFTHTLRYAFGSKTGTITTKTSNTSVTWTPSVNEFAPQIPNSTRGYGTLYIDTYSGSTLIGTKSYQFYCNVPDYVRPTFGTVTAIPTSINGNSLLIKNRNGLTVAVSGCNAGVGASIKSYKFSGPSISVTTTNTSVHTNSVTTAGTLTYTVTATDTRGRTASKTCQIVCYDYYVPKFTYFEVYRCNSTGNYSNTGNYLKCVYEIDAASINNTNQLTVKLTYITGGTEKRVEINNGSAIIELGENSAAYKVYATVTDSYGGVGTSSVNNVFGSSRILNIANDGEGFAIGKMSDRTAYNYHGLFECAFDGQFYRDVNIDGNLTIGYRSLLDIFYPIGCLYQSTNSISPDTYFGGEWEDLGTNTIGDADLVVYIWRRTA